MKSNMTTEIVRELFSTSEGTVTPEKVKAMTNKELRIKVAELCGWKRMRGICTGYEYWTLGYLQAEDADLPDYCNDLNAMHEAEMSLNADKQRTFRTQLNRVASSDVLCGLGKKLCHATARQRAEAFVLTFEK